MSKYILLLLITFLILESCQEHKPQNSKVTHEQIEKKYELEGLDTLLNNLYKLKLNDCDTVVSFSNVTIKIQSQYPGKSILRGPKYFNSIILQEDGVFYKSTHYSYSEFKPILLKSGDYLSKSSFYYPFPFENFIEILNYKKHDSLSLNNITIYLKNELKVLPKPYKINKTE